jgi:hypothetical protein
MVFLLQSKMYTQVYLDFFLDLLSTGLSLSESNGAVEWQENATS